MENIDIQDMSMLAQANYKKIMDGQETYQKFQEMTKDPMKHNEELLLKILDDNKDTEYGKKYDFASIKSVKEFQEKVPVSVYDDYADYIVRETENGEEHLLCAYHVGHYNKSSGTMGNPKRIPMSDPAVEISSRYNTNYMHALLGEKLGFGWIDGRTLSVAESADHVNYLKNGASYGALSVKVVLAFRDYLSLMFSSPDEATFPRVDTNTRYLHARFGLMDKGIAQGAASFCSFFLETLRYIEQKWELLVNDIEKGTIDESIKMADDVRESLLKKIQPMPERAAELRAIFSQGFEEPFVPKVWPNFSFLGAVATGGFKMYADKLREKYFGKDIHFYKVGLTASEGSFSVPFDMDCDDSALIPDSMFYEFLPLDAGDDFSQIVTMDNVEIGREYEVITTNLSGFYRYRMRDAVRITGKYNNLPTIQFLYRIDQTVSITGEKTTEAALRAAVENTAKLLEFELIDFSMYPDTDAIPARYLFFMELGKLPEGLKAKEIRFVLEQELARANPSMGAKVKSGVCGPTKLNILEPETYMLYRDLMQLKGTATSQIKPVRVISNEIQRKFFFGLTEYGVEVVR